jgi:hypothetical protein
VSEPAAKKRRSNYESPGAAKDKMDAAVMAWVDGEKGEDIATGKEVSQNKFTKHNELPPSTFCKKVKEYKASRTPLSGVAALAAAAAAATAARKRRPRGKPSLVSQKKQEFVVDVIVRADRAGLASRDIYEMIETLCNSTPRSARWRSRSSKGARRSRGD